jgi:hypothetical protein
MSVTSRPAGRFPLMLRTSVLLPLLLAASLQTLSAAGTWNPDPALGNVDAHRRIYEIGRNYDDPRFDASTNLLSAKPGHKGTVVRESIYYAFTLLLTGDPDDRAKAQPIIKAVIAAQDTREHSTWRGAFLWSSDLSWQTVQNPDLNSAAFVGCGLAMIADLDRKKPCLDDDVRKALDDSGKLAVEEIIRRNVDSGYTNISSLSAALASAGAKYWSVPGADKWADDKLSAVLKLAGDGAVYEYDSPTYSAVDLSGAYMMRQFAYSDAFAAKADQYINHLWKELSLAYHAPSYQLAGPYNRAYGNDMLTYAAGLKYDYYLATDGKYPLPEGLDTGHGWDQGGLGVLASLPIKARPELDITPPADRAWDAAGPDDGFHPVRHLHQHREGNFVLGTVENQDEWKQKRNLVADWRTDTGTDTPPGYRIGFCIDESNETLPGGFPYASIMFRSQQKGSAALVELEITHAIPPSGSCSLVFDTGAKVANPQVSPIVVEDGAITTYLYPVSNGTPAFESHEDDKTDQHVIQVNRDWSTADEVGKVHAISYLVVFRPVGKPEPKVSNLQLKDENGQLSTTATVDGENLSISAPE